MNHISHIHFRDNPGHAILSLGALQAVELIAKTGKEVVWLYVDYKIQYAIWTARHQVMAAGFCYAAVMSLAQVSKGGRRWVC